MVQEYQKLFNHENFPNYNISNCLSPCITNGFPKCSHIIISLEEERVIESCVAYIDKPLDL